jgi:hypothetical protein
MVLIVDASGLQPMLPLCIPSIVVAIDGSLKKGAPVEPRTDVDTSTHSRMACSA